MKGGPQTWDEFEKRPVSVTRACISLDGTRIAAIFADETLCIYDITTGEANLPPFKVDIEEPRFVIFSRDGELVASGGYCALRLWNAQTGEEVESFEIDVDVYSLAFSPDGNCLAAGCSGIDDPFSTNYNIRVINLELAKISYFRAKYFEKPGVRRIALLKGEVQHSPFEGHQCNVLSVAYSPDGKQIASGGSNDRSVRVWEVSTGSSRLFMTDCHRIKSLTFSPDGTQIAADIGLFNLSTDSFTYHAFGYIGGTKETVHSFSFMADGRLLASGVSMWLYYPNCEIWDASIHQGILRLAGHIGEVCGVNFFPDAKKIMSASADGTIRVWNVELLEERGEMDGWRMKGSGGGGYWVLGPEEEHLFWTAVPFRHMRNTLIIGRCPTIDFSNFVHGDEWVKCREPL